MAQFDDTKVAKVSNILTLGSILTILAVLGTQALYHVVDSQFTEARVTDTVFEEVEGLKVRQNKRLHSYSMDKASKKITIDIDQAMKLVVRDLSK